MMLEVARSIVQGPSPPKRSMMFIGFDLEEVGLFGSRYFVAHPPVALEKVVLFITADMIGRSLAGVCASHVFVMGTENAPGLRPGSTRRARAARSRSVCSAPISWCSIGATTGRSAAAAFLFSSSRPAKTRAITRPTIPPTRSTTPS